MSIEKFPTFEAVPADNGAMDIRLDGVPQEHVRAYTVIDDVNDHPLRRVRLEIWVRSVHVETPDQ